MKHTNDCWTLSIVDRGVRTTICALVLIYSFSNPISTTWFATMHVVSIYPFVTGLTGWDPLYSTFSFVKEMHGDYRAIQGDF